MMSTTKGLMTRGSCPTLCSFCMKGNPFFSLRKFWLMSPMHQKAYSHFVSVDFLRFHWWWLLRSWKYWMDLVTRSSFCISTPHFTWSKKVIIQDVKFDAFLLQHYFYKTDTCVQRLSQQHRHFFDVRVF